MLVGNGLGADRRAAMTCLQLRRSIQQDKGQPGAESAIMRLFQPNKAGSPGSQATCCLEAQSCWEPRRLLTLRLLLASGRQMARYPCHDGKEAQPCVASQVSDA